MGPFLVVHESERNRDVRPLSRVPGQAKSGLRGTQDLDMAVPKVGPEEGQAVTVAKNNRVELQCPH